MVAALFCCLSGSGRRPEERAALAGFVGLVGLATAGERVAFKVAIDQVLKGVPTLFAVVGFLHVYQTPPHPTPP